MKNNNLTDHKAQTTKVTTDQKTSESQSFLGVSDVKLQLQMANIIPSEDIDDISTYTARITEFDIKNELVPLR